MGGYLNDYEVADCLRIFNDPATPNLHAGARIVQALMDHADSSSDGWAYWRAPRSAAASLITALDNQRREYLMGHAIQDVNDVDLGWMLRPIKSFLTREKVNYHALLPWAALLPAA